MILAGAYTQKITYWAPIPIDGFGNRTFSVPVLLLARWEDRTDLNISNNQEFIPSSAQVHVQQAVALGGFLALGDYVKIAVPLLDPTTLVGAFMIMQYREIPGVRGSEFLRKAVL